MQNIEVLVYKYLISIGMNAKRSGFLYLVYAVVFSIKDNIDPRGNVSNLIYPYVADVFEKTPEAVEKAMRFFISESWKDENLRNALGETGLISPKKEKAPSNLELIIALRTLFRFVELDGAKKHA